MADILLPRRIAGRSGRARGLRIPTADTAVPQVQPRPDPGLRVPDFGKYAAGEDAGIGIMNFAEGIARAADRQQKEYDATETAEAKLAFNQQAMQEVLRRQKEDDPSRPQFMNDVGTWLGGDISRETGARAGGGLVGQVIDGLPPDVSQAARDRLRLELLGTAQGIEQAAGKLSLVEAQKRAQKAIAGLVNEWSAQAERDPGSLDLLLKNADDGLAPFKDAARNQLAAAKSQIIKSGLIGMARADPRDAETVLDSGKYDKELSATDRASVRAAAESERKERLRLAEKAERDAEKQMNIEADQALKDFYSMEAPTTADVEALRARPGVTPAEYKAALKAVTEDGATEDDRDFLGSIMPRLADEDLTLELTHGLETGKLKNDTYRTLINQNRAALKDTRPASPFKAGREMLSIALDPGQLGGDGTIRQPLAIARASALADFDTFAEANPQMDRRVAFDKARELTEQYQNVAFGQMTLALPRPRGYFGPKGEVTIEIVRAAQSNLAARIRAGEIGGNEAAREIQALDTWEALLSRQQKAKGK